jgi:surface antigen
MPMITHNTLSSYLVRPNLSPRRNRNWAGFRTRALVISRANPHILTKTFAALTIWTVFFASVRYSFGPHTVPGQGSFTSGQAAVTGTNTLSKSPATLTSAVPAQILPSGPSGQLLPPGTMAPQGSFANHYARGQCTWYVAGRRQIPSNWGNARNWYYHAVSSGWNTGTVPAVAAIAWTSAGYYGHVALVEQVSADSHQVLISEMNYRGVGVKSTRWVNVSEFKYIY